MSDFYPPPHPVPAGLDTAVLHLRPLRTDHAQLDYDALIVSKTMLRLWSGSDWPDDDFTLADNVQDLARHQREHEERLAFTYTVLTPAADQCLGCVYIAPLRSLQPHNPDTLTTAHPRDAIIRFWAVAPRLADNLDHTLFHSLRPWLRQSWKFHHIYFYTAAANQRQRDLFHAAALPHTHTLPIPSRRGLFHFYRDA